MKNDSILLRCGRLVVLVLALVPSVFAQPASTYQLPPKDVVDAFDAAPLPDATLSPSKKVIALSSRRGQASISEIAQPMLRLAGARINPNNFGQHRAGLVYAIKLKPIAGGAEIDVKTPPNARISNLRFSPDGSKLAFLNTRSDGIDLWVADAATGKTSLATNHANSTGGDVFDWMPDNATLLCKVVPAGSPFDCCCRKLAALCTLFGNTPLRTVSVSS